VHRFLDCVWVAPVQDADSHNLPPAEVCWTTDSILVNSGTTVELRDKDGAIATSAVLRYGTPLRLTLNKATGNIVVKNASNASYDVSGCTLECDGVPEVGVLCSVFSTILRIA
jgi:hypothetical protein